MEAEKGNFTSPHLAFRRLQNSTDQNETGSGMRASASRFPFADRERACVLFGRDMMHIEGKMAAGSRRYLAFSLWIIAICLLLLRKGRGEGMA